MKKIFITTLGRGNYQKTAFKLNDKVYSEIYFSCQALYEKIQPDRFYIVGTESSSWGIMNDVFTEEKYVPLHIPIGKNEEEWWNILELLTGIDVSEGDEIYFDITLAFRSIPIFLMISLLYFEKVYRCKIMGIFYGMFENRSVCEFEGKKIEAANIVDLSPVLRVNEWLEGLSAFNRSGNASLLAELLDKESSSGAASETAENMRRMTNAFGLNYTEFITKYSDEIYKAGDKIKEQFRTNKNAGSLVMDKVIDSLSAFRPKEDEGHIAIHGQIINWYLEHGHYTQFITLLYEALTTFLVENLDEKLVYNHEFREQVRREIGMNKKLIKKQFPELKPLFSMFMKLSMKRNFSGHGAMREMDKTMFSLEKAREECREIYEQFSDLVSSIELNNYLEANREKMLSLILDKNVVIDVSLLYKQDQTAKLEKLPDYLEEINLNYECENKKVTLTGPGPIWLYLKIAHHLHGKAEALYYKSPIVPELNIFEHFSFEEK